MFAPAINGQRSPKTRPHNTGAYSQARELQELLMRDARQEGLKPLERAGIARAWTDLEETKRKLKMKPLPKSVDVSTFKKPKSNSRGPGFAEG